MTGPKILPLTDDALNIAAAAIRAGQLVAFPTETVYGLGADATNDQAIAKIFSAKKRPKFNPLIIHVADMAQAAELVELDERAITVAQTFWPGPISMVLKRRANCAVSLLAGAGLETLAVRAPAHRTAQALIRTCGVPLAAPSANRSGQVSPTTPQHVADSLADVDDLKILAGGKCRVGLESTVLDLSGPQAEILRYGAITAEDLEPLIGDIILPGDNPGHDSATVKKAESGTVPSRPKSPGQTLRHYAPSIPVRLDAIDVAPNEALLGFGPLKFMGIKGGGFARDLPDGQVLNLSPAGDLNEAAANLFAMLRALDKPQFSAIAVMNIPNTGLGLAINDRLQRAAKACSLPDPQNMDQTDV